MASQNPPVYMVVQPVAFYCVGLMVTAFAFHSVLSIPVFTPVLQYAIGIGTGFGLAFLLTLMVGFDQKIVPSEKKKQSTTTSVSIATD